MKKGLVLDKVVLLGRTLEEYRRSFALDLEVLRGKHILDVASGVSSFCFEARVLGLHVTALDVIYDWPPETIRRQCESDLDKVVDAIRELPTYRWSFYRTPAEMRAYRERAYRAFLEDYPGGQGRSYIPGRLPHLPFPDNQFDLTLVSYLLFAYEDQLAYDFHKQSLVEIMRVTRGELRIYPIVTFEAKRSAFVGRLGSDPDLKAFAFEERETDFEFLRNSNYYLCVHRR